MIVINIYKSEDNFRKITIEGHADYAEYGYDIVCSAISAVTITIVNGLKDVCKIDEIEILYSPDGLIHIFVPDELDKENRKITNLFLSTLELGYKDIWSNYPENIELNIYKEE